MSPVVPFVLLLVIAVAVLYWMALRHAADRIATQYARLAEVLGLELTQPAAVMGGFIRPEPSLHGHHEGREISISVPGKGLQNTRQIETVLKVELKHSSFAAQIVPNGVFGGIRQRDSRGMQRWKSGDEDFDKAWDLRTAPGQAVAQVFHPAMRDALSQHMGRKKGSLYIGSGTIAYAELGLISDAATRERFEHMLRALFELAEAIEATQGLQAKEV
ncbi:MAG: hypothetical protein ACLFU4_02130 [Opitutales bacterium]